jgi:purine-binding chemotaxis protein CheW
MYKMENPGKQFVVFKLDAQSYAIDINKISEMVEIQNLRSGDNIPLFAIGTIEVKSDSVPVVDLRKRFHLAKVPDTRDNRILVVDCKGREIGIKVDSVTELIQVQESGIDPIDCLFIGEHLEHLLGVVRYKDRPIILMDLDKILSKVDQGILKQWDMNNTKVLC